MSKYTPKTLHELLMVNYSAKLLQDKNMWMDPNLLRDALFVYSQTLPPELDEPIVWH